MEPLHSAHRRTNNPFLVFGTKVQVPRRIPSTPFYRNFETYPTSSDLAEKVQRQAAYDLRKSLRVRGVFGTLSAFNFFLALAPLRFHCRLDIHFHSHSPSTPSQPGKLLDSTRALLQGTSSNFRHHQYNVQHATSSSPYVCAKT
jgi:hypothetical protein